MDILCISKDGSQQYLIDVILIFSVRLYQTYKFYYLCINIHILINGDKINRQMYDFNKYRFVY